MRRFLFFLSFLLPAFVSMGPVFSKPSQPARVQPPRTPPSILVASFEGIISPVSAEFMTEAVSRAERESRDALVLVIDTPGGLETSMRDIVKAILGSRVPVIVYVHPAGARAASAGVFIAMAAHVAAMTPGTNIGAAHPVALGALPGSEKGK